MGGALVSGFWLLVGKELRIEARGREMFSGGLLLAFLVLLVGNLAWAGVADAPRVASGVLWVGYVFAGTLVLSRSLHRERDRGTWEALAVLPVDWGTVYFVKVASSGLILLLLQFLSLGIYAALFDFDLLTPLIKLAPLLLLGTIGFCALGVLLAGLSSHARTREILLPILLLPLILPLLMMAIQATQKVLSGLPSSAALSEHLLLLAFDAIYLAIGWLTFDHVLSD